jgi:DNA-binding CsgD family transcriptional regulator
MLAIADAELAQKHGLFALCDLTRAQVAVQAEIRDFLPDGRAEILAVVDVGWASEGQRALAVRPYFTQGCSADPSAFRLMQRVASDGTQLLARRSDLIGDSAWYRSEFFNEARSRADIDHLIHSVTSLPNAVARQKKENVISGVTVIRERGDRDFSADEMELVGLFHNGAWPLWNRHRLRTTEELVASFPLSPRERQTISCLLDGQSPSEVADTLGISRNTCHQYIKSIYRKLGVRSRAQLLARLAATRRFP